MSSVAKHPQIDQASDEKLADLLQGKTPEIRQLFLATHRLILETLPDVKYATDSDDGTTGYGIRQYGYDGWGMAALAAHARWVTLMFLSGTDLEKHTDLLEGAGKKMRHVKLRSMEQFAQQKNELRMLIEVAAKINS